MVQVVAFVLFIVFNKRKVSAILINDQANLPGLEVVQAFVRCVVELTMKFVLAVFWVFQLSVVLLDHGNTSHIMENKTVFS